MLVEILIHLKDAAKNYVYCLKKTVGDQCLPPPRLLDSFRFSQRIFVLSHALSEDQRTQPAQQQPNPSGEGHRCKSGRCSSADPCMAAGGCWVDIINEQAGVWCCTGPCAHRGLLGGVCCHAGISDIDAARCRWVIQNLAEQGIYIQHRDIGAQSSGRGQLVDQIALKLSETERTKALVGASAPLNSGIRSKPGRIITRKSLTLCKVMELSMLSAMCRDLTGCPPER